MNPYFNTICFTTLGTDCCRTLSVSVCNHKIHCVQEFGGRPIWEQVELRWIHIKTDVEQGKYYAVVPAGVSATFTSLTNFWMQDRINTDKSAETSLIGH